MRFDNIIIGGGLSGLIAAVVFSESRGKDCHNIGRAERAAFLVGLF